MRRRISESARRNRVGAAYALTVVRARAAGRERRLEALSDGAAGGRREPVRAARRRCTSSRVQLVSELVHQGPQQRHTRPAARSSSRVHEHDRRRARAVPGALRRGRRRRRVVAALRRLSRRAATRRRSRAGCATTRSTAACLPSAHPEATVADVLEALALRERVIDFAVEAQGLDAAELQARFRVELADARPPAERPPPSGRRARIDLADIQGNVLRGYTMPAAAYLFLRDRRRRARARADEADAPAGERPRSRGGGPPARDERRVHVLRARALGLPDAMLASFPRGVPRGHGGARGAARRPRPERARALGARGSAPARRTCSSPSTPSTHERLTARARRSRSSAPTRERRRAGAPAARRGAARRRATTSASSTASPSPRSQARASRRGRATASRTARGGWRDVADRRGRCSATSTRTARCPRRRPRRSTATARSSSTASWRWTSPRSGATWTTPGYPGRPDALAAKIVGRWPDGTPLVRLPGPPGRRDRRRPAAINDFALRGRPATACAARSAPTSAAPTRATPRLLRRPAHQPPPDRPPRPRLRPAARAAARLEDDGVDRGLVFVCFQADIWRQFETIQALWIDDGDPFGLGRDKDFLIGEPHGTQGKMTIQGHPPFFLKPQPRFVTLRGGDYLFQPSMTALRVLAGGV